MALTWITNPLRIFGVFRPAWLRAVAGLILFRALRFQNYLFLEDDFFDELLRRLELFLLPPFLGGTFAPERRASLKPIAIACFLLFTFFLPPDFNCPCLYSCMVFCIFFRTVRFDFGPDPEEVRFLEPDLDPLLLLVATTQPSVLWRQAVNDLFQTDVAACV